MKNWGKTGGRLRTDRQRDKHETPSRTSRGKLSLNDGHSWFLPNANVQQQCVADLFFADLHDAAGFPCVRQSALLRLFTLLLMLNTMHSPNNGQTCCFHIQHWGWMWSQCICPGTATVVYCFQIMILLGNVLNSAFEISDALDRAALILLLLSALCQLILFVLTWMLIFCHWLWCWWLSYSSDSCFDSVQEY